MISAYRQRAFDINLPVGAERYTLTAKQLEDGSVQLNGNALHLTSSGELPQLKGEPTKSGRVSFAPTSITFLGLEKASNDNCR